MAIIKSLTDPFVRESLFKGYNKRCVYCRNPLLFKNMQIDHVIPKSYGKEKAISNYGLNPDFELDSYYNLVPSCASCNNMKRAKTYKKIQILFILNEVKSKVPYIERIEKKLRKNDLTEEFSITLKKAVSEVQIYELIKMLDDNNLTSLQHYILQEALQKLKPISTLTPTENHQIQVFIDEVNIILDEFAKIKSYFNSPINRFADDKAGIVIVNEFAGMVTYSLFAVSKKELNIIRELTVDQWRSLANLGIFKYRTTDLKNHILEQPKTVARENLFKYIAKLLSTNALYKSKNNLIGTEFIIDFINQYKIQLGLDFKNEYSIDDLINSFQYYLPFWIDEALKKADKSVIDRVVKRRGYVTLSFIEFLTGSFRKEIKERVLNRLDLKKKYYTFSEYAVKLPIITEKLPFKIFTDFTRNFKKNGFKTIKRIYDPPNYEREKFKKSHRVYDAYSNKSVKKKLSFIYNNLINVYNDVIKRNFLNLVDVLIPFSDYTKIIIEIHQVRNNNYEKRVPFSYKEFYLEGEKSEDLEIIFYDSPADIIPNDFRKNKVDILMFRGKNYKAGRRHEGIVSDIYQPSPLFNKIHEILTEKFLNLFETDYKKFIAELRKIL